MTNSKMREEFEVWARKNSMDLEYRNIPNVGQFYQCPRTLLAFEAWQASREVMVIELPVFVGAHPQTQKYVRDRCEEIIKEAGIKVKS